MELFVDGFTAEDPAYNTSRDGTHPMDVSARDLCYELRVVFELFTGGHYVDQFQRDFDARFWEMDLTCNLLDQDLDVSCPIPGPDICFCIEGSDIWVEAISPSNGCGKNTVPELEPGVATSIPDEQVVLRLTAAIAEKRNKY